MLIDCSYFTDGPRHILNASAGTLPNPNAVETANAIKAYISSLQRFFLERMLGTELADKFGKYICEREYTYSESGEYEKLAGMLRESFADYVFFHIIKDNTQATLTGLVRLKCANEYVSPIRRQVTAWNMMVDRNRRFEKWSSSTECPFSGITVSRDMLTKINVLNL